MKEKSRKIVAWLIIFAIAGSLFYVLGTFTYGLFTELGLISEALQTLLKCLGYLFLIGLLIFLLLALLFFLYELLRWAIATAMGQKIYNTKS